MRPETPTLDSRAEFRSHVEAYADRTGGRFGAVVARWRDGDLDPVYEHRADEPFTAASVIKLPVLYALYDAYEDRLADLRRPHDVAPENRVGGSGVVHLFGSTRPSLEDLARAMISISDNAATNEVVDAVGVDAVNGAAESLGMTGTRLDRKLMVADEGTLLGPHVDADADDNTVSPADCARFFADLLGRETLAEEAYDRMLVPLRNQKYGGRFPRYYPYEEEVLHKTGTVSDAALDAGVWLPEDDDPVVFGLMYDDLPNRADGGDAIAEIGDAVRAWVGE